MSYIFIKSDKTLDDEAIVLRDLLNIPEHNVTEGIKDQDRDSINHGGAYYLFEIMGLELNLLENKGEVGIPQKSDYKFYIYIRPKTLMLETIQPLVKHITAFLISKGIEAIEGES